MPDLDSSMNGGFHVLNGIIVVSFRDKERNVDLNGFYVFRKRELSIMDRILDFMCIKSI